MSGEPTFPEVYGEVARRWTEHALRDEDGEAPQITAEWATNSGEAPILYFALWLNDRWDGDTWEPDREKDDQPFCTGYVKWDGCANIDFPRQVHTCGGELKGGWRRMADALAWMHQRIAEIHPDAYARSEFASPRPARDA